jgi:osmoprotectant transport system permease protein
MTQKAKFFTTAAVLGAVALGLVVYWAVRPGPTGLVAGFNSEFMVRDDGYPGLQEAYNFSFGSENVKQMDTGLMYKACADGDVDVICGFSTDGLISELGLQMLKDDKDFWPPYFACPVIRRETIETYPQVTEVLAKLGNEIDVETMRDLNYQATRSEDPRRSQDVAREFLIERGLIQADASPGSGEAGTITVASKNFTENAILGDMMGMLIEMNTDLAVERKRNLSTLACNTAIQAGDVDIYPEYTGTALVTHLGMKPRKDPDEVYNIVKDEYARRWNLVWLDPFGFENRYTLTMRADRAKELGIESISDLADYVNNQPEE